MENKTIQPLPWSHNDHNTNWNLQLLDAKGDRVSWYDSDGELIDNTEYLIQCVNEHEKLKQENEYLNGLRGELLYYKGLNNLLESYNMMEELKSKNSKLKMQIEQLSDIVVSVLDESAFKDEVFLKYNKYYKPFISQSRRDEIYQFIDNIKKEKE